MLAFFIKYEIEVGYTKRQLIYGISASFFVIIGRMFLMYAATYGLAGPSSAMVQTQGLFHTMFSAIFLGIYPSSL